MQARLPLVFSLFLAAAAPSLAGDRPNVLFVIADDLQACLGSYGNAVCETPHMDRIAREGVRFSKAYCQYPVCGPSRASMMSGLYPETTTILGNAIQLGSYRSVNPKLADHPSMAGFLREQNYFTARVSKIFHMGVPGGIERGDVGGDDPDSWDYAFNVMGPETLSPGTRMLLSPNRKHYGSSFSATMVPDELQATQTDYIATSQAIAILESRARPVIEGATNKLKHKPDSPFFLAVGLVRPHVPLIAPRRLFERYPAADMQLPEHPEDDLEDIPEPARLGRNEGRYDMTDDQQRQALAAYYASVTFMDEQVGRLLDALDRLGLRENTIVVLTSDHGWNTGEHGCWQKLSLWEDSTRVPLILSAPGFEDSAGRTCASLVELIDLYPTLVDLCGMQDEAPNILQGRTLRPFLENPERIDADQAAYTVTTKGARSLRLGDWRYSDWGDAGEELYDHARDPLEFTNLAAKEGHAETLERMRRLLKQKTADAGGKPR